MNTGILCALFLVLLTSLSSQAAKPPAKQPLILEKNQNSPIIIQTGPNTTLINQISDKNRSFDGLQIGGVVGLGQIANHIKGAQNQYWQHQGIVSGFYVGTFFEKHRLILGIDGTFLKPIMKINTHVNPALLANTYHVTHYKQSIAFSGRAGINIRHKFFCFIHAGYTIQTFDTKNNNILFPNKKQHTLSLPQFGFGIDFKIFPGLIGGVLFVKTPKRNADQFMVNSFHSFTFKLAKQFS